MTTTELLLGEVQLVNIISVSELRLQRNFELFVRCLQEHAGRLEHIERKQLELAEQLTATSQQTHIKSAQLETVQCDISAHLAQLQATCQELSTRTDDGAARSKESIQLVGDQLRNINGLADERHLQLTTRIELLQGEMTALRTTSERMECEAQSVRKESAQIKLKADTSYKKSKLLEERLEVVDEKLSKIHTEATELKSTIAANEQKQQEEERQSKENSGTNKRMSVHRLSLPNELMGRSSEVLVHNQLKETYDELRQRVQQLETMMREESVRNIERINLELREVQNAKEDIKQLVDREKNSSAVTAALAKVEEFRPELQRLMSRIEISEDRNHTLDRKFEESKRAITDVHMQLRESGSGRFEEKLRTLQTDLINQIKEINCRLEEKTSRTDFVKECDLFKERYRQLSDLLSTKCDKLEVKKALLFIEAKIKEIILVISEDEENEKEALLTKKNVKCISCDKELDRFTGLVSVEPRNWNVLPTRELQADSLGRFGITKYGSLTRKLRKLDNSDLPVLQGRRTTE